MYVVEIGIMTNAITNKTLFQQTCTIRSIKKVASNTFIHEYESSDMGRIAQPGQFVQIRTTDAFTPLLPRPMSILSADNSKGSVSVLFKLFGEATVLLSQKKVGDSVGLLGPLGNTFQINKYNNLIMVVGGVGLPPLFYLINSLDLSKTNVHLFSGYADKSQVLLNDELSDLNIDLSTTTDDGSYGIKGLVTEPFENHLSLVTDKQNTCIIACGPILMLATVQRLSLEYNIPAQLSVETVMACGIGICQGCIMPKTGNDGKQCGYHLVCVDGPVFSEKEVIIGND